MLQVYSFGSRNNLSCRARLKGRYIQNLVISMLEFLVGSILVEFEGHIFQQTIDMLMGTNCSPIANLFRYYYEAEVMHKQAFILTFGHIDDVLWLNNPNFADMIPLIYPQRNNRNSFLSLNRQLPTSYCNKTEDFTLPLRIFHTLIVLYFSNHSHVTFRSSLQFVFRLFKTSPFSVY